MAIKPDELEELICEGKIDGIFAGFRNHDTIFKIQGAGSWRQDEYKFEYHHLFSPKAKIVKVIKKDPHREVFYLHVDGVKTQIEVKYAYV